MTLNIFSTVFTITKIMPYPPWKPLIVEVLTFLLCAKLMVESWSPLLKKAHEL